MQSRNLRNLKIVMHILRIWKLHANLEITQPIMRLCNTLAQSRDCSSAICERNGMTRWQHLSWQTEESWELSKLVKPLNGGTSQVWGLSTPVPRPREGSFSELANFPEHARHWWWWQSYRSSLRMFLTFIHDGNSNKNLGSIVHAAEIAWSQDCTLVPCNLEIA